MDVVGLVILASVVTATAVTPLTITIVADIVLRMLSIVVRVSEMIIFGLPTFLSTFENLFCRAFGEACKAQLNDLFH